MKTSELMGPALDWAVAKAADYLSRQGNHWMVKLPYVSVRMNFVPGPRCVFTPSTRWAQGGPFIEQEKICLTRPRWDGQWTALLVYEDRSFDGVASVEFDAPTPLVAAMRCYVQSRLGDEVEIPEELQ